MNNDTTAKEQSLNPTSTGNPGRSQLKPAVRAAQTEEPLDDRILMAIASAGEKKAIDTVVLDLREVATFTDYFVLVSGANQRQVQAISDGIAEHLKVAGTPVARIEGYKTAEWILLDYGDFIVHVFDEKARKFYDLERLWRESKRVALPEEIGPDSSLRN
jgi:ribosome-associated protein